MVFNGVRDLGAVDLFTFGASHPTRPEAPRPPPYPLARYSGAGTGPRWCGHTSRLDTGSPYTAAVRVAVVSGVSLHTRRCDGGRESACPEWYHVVHALSYKSL